MYLSSPLYLSSIVFVVALLLVRSFFLIALIECLKGQKSQRLKVFSKMYLKLSLSLYLSLSLSFCWSSHVFSSLWSNVSKVKSLNDCSLKVFSKCNCHCLFLCLIVVFLLEGFESNTANMQNSDQGRPTAARAAKKRGPKGNQILNKMGTGRAP